MPLPLIGSEGFRPPTHTTPLPAPPKEAMQRIGSRLHSVGAPLTPSLISSVFRNRKSSKSSHSQSPPVSGETNSMAPISVVSSHSAQDDGGECPVCLDPLSFSVRLPGEQPHIVPECRHALHEVP